MSDAGPAGSARAAPLEIEVEPTVVGRIARWLSARASCGPRRGRARRPRVGRPRLRLIERDSSIGGGLLAGALAYRLFVLLLPSALLFVSGLGLYADTVDKSPSTVAEEAGLHGLIASQVASTASGAPAARLLRDDPGRPLRHRQALPRRRDRARDRLARFGPRRAHHSEGSRDLRRLRCSCSRSPPSIVGWIRRHGPARRAQRAARLHRRSSAASGSWSRCSCRTATLAGRRSFRARSSLGVGLLCINVFNVYVTTRLVEERADTYGALGIAAALLFSLVLVGRLFVVSAELNASLWHRGAGQGSPG